GRRWDGTVPWAPAAADAPAAPSQRTPLPERNRAHLATERAVASCRLLPRLRTGSSCRAIRSSDETRAYLTMERVRKYILSDLGRQRCEYLMAFMRRCLSW